MKMKKIASVLLIFCFTASLIGCGSSVPAVNDNMPGESSEIVEGSIDGIEETTGAEERESTVIPALTDAPTPTETPNPMPTPTAEPTPEPTASPIPTESPHSHQYTETVTRQATCAVAGEKTLVCECGDTKVESIAATGNHNWVEGVTVVHHEALGHVAVVRTQTGTTETRHEYECRNCGYRTDTPGELSDHRASFVPADPIHATASTIIHDIPGEPIYEETQVWQVDQEAWDESVGNGVFTCTVCGATK